MAWLLRSADCASHDTAAVRNILKSGPHILGSKTKRKYAWSGQRHIPTSVVTGSLTDALVETLVLTQSIPLPPCTNLGGVNDESMEIEMTVEMDDQIQTLRPVPRKIVMTKSCWVCWVCWVWLRRSIFIDTQLWAANITSRHACVRTCRDRSGQDGPFRKGRAKVASLNPLYGGNVAKAKSRAHGVPKLDAGWTITHPSHTHRVARGRKLGRSTPPSPPKAQTQHHLAAWSRALPTSSAILDSLKSPHHRNPIARPPTSPPGHRLAVRGSRCVCRRRRRLLFALSSLPLSLPRHRPVAPTFAHPQVRGVPPIPRRPPCSPLIVWRIDRPLLATPLDTPCRCAAPPSPPSLRPRPLPRRVRAHREKPWRRSRS